MRKVKVGVIGCGMISEVYLSNLTGMFENILEVLACADILADAANKRAEQFGSMAVSVDDLIADPAIEVVLNLTTPASHYSISKRALTAGKHVYSEKPLAASVDEGKELVALAKEKGLFLCAAPDTFLGAGMQTCRSLIENGAIGIPIAAQGFMLAYGPERFHPNPEFFYKDNAGPLLDMGPYYLTALTALFGPVCRVNGLSSALFGTRTVLNEKSPNYLAEFPCCVGTYVSGGIEFESGLTANLTATWDMPFPYWESGFPLLTVFGNEGTLVLPDPNMYGGIGGSPWEEPGKFVKLRLSAGEFEEIPIKDGYTTNSRGLGLADMAWCILNGGKPKASGEIALHVLETMLGILKSSKSGMCHVMETSCIQPDPLYDKAPFAL